MAAAERNNRLKKGPATPALFLRMKGMGKGRKIQKKKRKKINQKYEKIVDK